MFGSGKFLALRLAMLITRVIALFIHLLLQLVGKLREQPNRTASFREVVMMAIYVKIIDVEKVLQGRLDSTCFLGNLSAAVFVVVCIMVVTIKEMVDRDRLDVVQFDG